MTLNIINVKTKFIKTVIGYVVAHLKQQKNHHFVRFVMYCFFTTVPVAYSTEHVWDDTVRYINPNTDTESNANPAWQINSTFIFC